MKFSTFSVLFLIGAVEINADQKLLRGGFTSSDTGGRGLQTDPSSGVSTNVPFQFPDFFETTGPPTTTANPFEFQGFGPTTPNLGGLSQEFNSFANYAFDFDFGADSDSSQNCPSRSLTSFVSCLEDGGGPVRCGPDDCEYDSVCAAEGADFAEDVCFLVNPVVAGPDNNGNSIDSSACPVPASVPCPANFDPVVCGGACQYSNLCVAENAEFAPEECESGTLPSPPEEPPSGINVKPPEEPPPLCPRPDLTGDGCPEIFNPVSCDDCVYENICFAEAASFLETDCEPAIDDQKESCPVASGMVACIAIFAPVLCDGTCFYPSICEARAAEYTDDQCADAEPPPPLCPVPKPTVAACPLDIDIVRCGPADCTYDNSCLAAAAGFDPVEGCKPDCPIGNRGIVECPEVFEPVLCNGVCVYDNFCSAQNGPGFTEEDCEPVEVMIPVAPAEKPECKEPDPGFCIALFEPVVCDGCQYENSCVALGAGYSDSDCEPLESIPVDPLPPVVVSPNANCPKSESVEPPCSRNIGPVDCDGCVYFNICFAGAAGFPENDCEPAVDQNDAEEPVSCTTAELFCEDDVGPVICDNSCNYSYLCIATASGYSEDQCVSIATEVIPVNSPKGGGCLPTDPDLICVAVFMPVVCNGCDYENSCVATGAGYDEGQCQPLRGVDDGECPLPDPDRTINSIVTPLLCEYDNDNDNLTPPVLCEYDNFSVARAAGFKVSECIPVVQKIEPRNTCPEAGQVPCNKMYAPVICDDSCRYSNLCLGLGAGFLESDCLPADR